MTLSTRLNNNLAPRLAEAVKGVGVAPSDLAREGLARVLAEYEATGSVQFGVSTHRVSAATDSAGRRATPRKRKTKEAA